MRYQVTVEWNSNCDFRKTNSLEKLRTHKNNNLASSYRGKPTGFWLRFCCRTLPGKFSFFKCGIHNCKTFRISNSFCAKRISEGINSKM